MNDALLHSLLALKAQLEAGSAQIDALLELIPTCRHPKEQRQYLTGFGVTPTRYLCRACGCEIEEGDEEVSDDGDPRQGE